MDDLVRWYGEQLDADAARATTAAEELGADWDYDDGYVVTRREGDMVATGSQDFLEAERGRFIAEHDPARVLRDIEAKRALLHEHRIDGWRCSTCANEETFDDDADGNREWSRGGKDFPCPTLRLIAAPYADRPGYREEWRP
ncbi:DUF6221 family protein [Streptomyces sp. NPDC005574]|uniref:DUF6221 family protein n=1 Tax=Streptomyces sp. NPDC005574 TaxID=3156891 RepID=UPI0033BE041A